MGPLPEMKIRIKPIRQKAEKAKLPSKVDKDYPAKQLAVFVAPEVLQDILRFASSDMMNELGGVLVGKVGKASRRIFVEIKNFIPAIYLQTMKVRYKETWGEKKDEEKNPAQTLFEQMLVGNIKIEKVV